MRRAGHIALVSATIVTGWSAAPALAAGPPPATLHCGQAITRDTTLANDLVDCPGTALTIAADGVTLDLGGHVVDGTNAAGSIGIAVDGKRRVTIRHGSVRDFHVNGVALEKSPRGRVAGLTVTKIGAGGAEGEASAGIFVKRSDDIELESNRVSNDVVAWQADGIVVLESKRAKVVGNNSSRNAWNGIVVVGSAASRVLHNRVCRNQNSGILLADSPDATVKGNVAARQPNPDTAGIAILQSTGSLVVDNRLSGNSASGIVLESKTSGATVSGNRVRGGGNGIALLDSDKNTIAGNDIDDVGENGILLDKWFLHKGSQKNTLARNTITGSGAAGILITGKSAANELIENHVSDNGADGIRLVTAGNRVRENVANDNDRRGIQAVGGTVDGGGNRARGNGRSPQCVGVACS